MVGMGTYPGQTACSETDPKSQENSGGEAIRQSEHVRHGPEAFETNPLVISYPFGVRHNHGLCNALAFVVLRSLRFAS